MALWRDKIVRATPLLVALAALAGAVAWLLSQAQVAGAGHNLYALDDPYIHMAMARNLAEHGVWGVNSHSFTGSSSSMLWTLLLAGLFRVFGSLVWLPLALNMLSAAGIVLLLNHLMPRADGAGGLAMRTAALVGIALLTPLPSLVFFGMENTLHVFLAIALCYVAAREIAAPAGKPNFLLLALAMLAVTARLESLFIVSGIMILLAVRRQWLNALLTGAAAVLPVVIYGLISVHQGWMWLPNSVLVKGNMPQVDLPHYVLALAGRVYGQIAAERALFALIALSLVLLEALRRTTGSTAKIWSNILTLTLWALLLHLMFAKLDTGRYEAYLMALLLTGSFCVMIEYRNLHSVSLRQVVAGHWGAVLLVFLLLAPVAVRAGHLAASVAPAVGSVYRQQVLMGTFVGKYWPRATVVLNDIGAVSYLAPQSRCVDMAGLATMETGRWMLTRSYTVEKLQDFVIEQQADMAMVNDAWLRLLPKGIPPRWVKLAEWTTLNAVSPAHATVAIYATKPAVVGRLRRDLKAFEASFPPGVISEHTP